MHNKKYYIGVLCLAFLFVMISFVSAVKPSTTIVTTDSGLLVEPTIKDYLRTGEDHSFEIHLFNQSDGSYIVSDTSCYMHLYHKDGSHIYEGVDNSVDHDFDYSFDLTGGNFSSRGEYQAKFQCNHTSGIAGASEIFFLVNDYGEDLSEAESHTFNMSMIFLIILFTMAIVGLFVIENYIGKFVLYWVCHLLFIAGTFSIWQFNMGYAIGFVGLAGIWKVLFYVSTIAVTPMIFVSIAWIVYIHLFNEHFQKLIDKGVDTEEAFRLTNKKRGGRFNGQ